MPHSESAEQPAEVEVLPPARTLADLNDPWAKEIANLRPEDLLLRARQLWPELKLAEWKFGLVQYRIWDEQLWAPHNSYTAYCRAEFGDQSSAKTAKIREGTEFMLSIEDPEEQARVLAQTTPQMLAEAGVHRLAKVDHAEAVRVASSGTTTRVMREAVEGRLAAREHRDVGGFRNLHFSAISIQAHRAFIGTYRRVRFLCQTPKPTDSELLELIAKETDSGLQIQPETLQWAGRIAFSLRFVLDDDVDHGIRQQLDAELGELPDEAGREELGLRFICAGFMRCIECGASNGNGLEGNHTVPKSHQGHSSPMVPMCGDDHREFTESIDAHWKVQNRLWMNRSDLDWFKAAMEAWLNGRRLEGL